MSALLLLLLLASPAPTTKQEVDCTYAGFCCQTDRFLHYKCGLRLSCRGKRTQELRSEADGGITVVSPGECR